MEEGRITKFIKIYDRDHFNKTWTLNVSVFSRWPVYLLRNKSLSTNIILRIFERLVCKQELSHVLKDEIGPDQLAYMEGRSTSMALIKCQHNWLDWLDKDADFV